MALSYTEMVKMTKNSVFWHVFFEVPVSAHMETLNKQLDMHVYSSKSGQD